MQLLTHPDRTDLAFCTRTSKFRYKGRVVPGLLRRLKRSMWPDYSYERTNGVNGSRYSRRDPGLRNRMDGLRRGSRVHEELERLTNYGAAAIPTVGGTAQVEEYTVKHLLAFKHWGWRVLCSEVAVYDPDLGIATSVDLFVLDRNGRLVMIEDKNGFFSSWERGNAPMRGPLLSRTSNAPQHQAQVQLLFAKRMVEKYGIHVDRAYVVRAHPDGVERCPLPPSLEQSGQLLEEHVALHGPPRKR